MYPRNVVLITRAICAEIIIKLVVGNAKIPAIKLLRSEGNDMGLKHAKLAIDAFQRTLPTELDMVGLLDVNLELATSNLIESINDTGERERMEIYNTYKQIG